LAKELSLPFVDSDAEIELQTGRSISDIFESSGEAAFREMERRMLAQICAGPRSVVSTGGGAPLDAANREAMQASGVIAWLDAPVDILVNRMQQLAAHGRPLLGED